MGAAVHTLAQALPRRDRWVIMLVVVALAALILGFAASAPAFDARGPGMPGDATTGLAATAAGAHDPMTTIDGPTGASDDTSDQDRQTHTTEIER